MCCGSGAMFTTCMSTLHNGKFIPEPVFWNSLHVSSPHVLSAILCRWSMGMSYLRYDSWLKGLWSYIKGPRKKNVYCFIMQSYVMMFPVLLCQSSAYIPSMETTCCKYHGFGRHCCCQPSRQSSASSSYFLLEHPHPKLWPFLGEIQDHVSSEQLCGRAEVLERAGTPWPSCSPPTLPWQAFFWG